LATTTGQQLVKQSSNSLQEIIVKRTDLQLIEQQVRERKQLHQERLIKLRKIRERIIKGHNLRSRSLHKQLTKVNQELYFFSEQIRVGERYENNITRVDKLRQRKERLITKIIEKNDKTQKERIRKHNTDKRNS